MSDTNEETLSEFVAKSLTPESQDDTTIAISKSFKAGFNTGITFAKANTSCFPCVQEINKAVEEMYKLVPKLPDD